ncbi:hypothetical protein A9K97_gp098 [Tokyovirus A1]|uniref:hypothetical protein n=1 Tax=Tokyovirus A1 TaxID=1826170 RepID=UPI0007A98ED6|nr:hypothetical protein A9K97_gp098 [Tokyovirus A1]BAU80253.1 conserved hypothetical protein [Tokyovirus A1]
MSHKTVLFEHTTTRGVFFLDTKGMKIYTPNPKNPEQKLVVCTKVSVDTANDNKVWFKGTHINGEEFFLKATMKDGKVLFRGNNEKCTIKYIC